MKAAHPQVKKVEPRGRRDLRESPATKAMEHPGSEHRAVHTAGLTTLDLEGGLGALHALHSVVGGAQFWNPDTLSGVPPEMVEAYLEDTVGSSNPRRLNELRGIRDLPLIRRIPLAKEILKGASSSLEIRRPLAYAALLPYEVVSGYKDLGGGKTSIDVAGTALTWIPSGLSADTISLTGCDLLRRIPHGVVARESLYAMECGSLMEVQGDLHAGDLYLEACPQLEKLGSGIHVDGVLNLRKCGKLRALPHDLFVGAAALLCFSGIEEIHTSICLGQDVRARTLQLSGCANLRSLPEGMELDGLVVDKCLNLLQLPKRLRTTVLNVENCPQLHSLPSDLHVTESMWLKGSGLDELDLEVLEALAPSCAGVTFWGAKS